ncbi:MAG: DUF6941 family protein [Tepidiformaceae bacterium]
MVSDRIDIDFVILADWAQVVAGKLYLQGGGWDTLTAQSFPHQQNIAVAVGLKVPWGATNQKYTVTINVVNEDTQAGLIRLEGQLESGRPPGIAPGADQLVTMALNSAGAIPSAGSYLVTASINGEERRRKAFRVLEQGRRP